MAKKVRIEMNAKAIRKLLRSPEVRADLERRARNIANAAGKGFAADSIVTSKRARAMVYTSSYEGMRAEAEQRALTRAIDAGRQ